MTKRLQVLFDDVELREIKRVARARRMSVAEWVRQTLRAARSEGAVAEAQQKLGAVREASRQGFPTGEIEEVLAQIERGYLAADRS